MKRRKSANRYIIYIGVALLALIILINLIRGSIQMFTEIRTETIILLISSLLSVMIFKPDISKILPLAGISALTTLVVTLLPSLSNITLFTFQFIIGIPFLIIYFITSLVMIFVLELIRKGLLGD